MAKKYQCTECGAVWTSPFNPMFCNTKGCKSKKFAAVEETQPVVSAPVVPSPVLPPVPAPVSVSPPVIIPQVPPPSDIVETKKEEPVIAPNGNIYIGLAQIRHTGSQIGHCGVFVCVDSVSYQIKWEFPTSALIESTPALGRNEIVYFGDNDGNIVGVDTRRREQWRSKVDCAVRSSGILLNENLLVFGLDDGTFAVFDIR